MSLYFFSKNSTFLMLFHHERKCAPYPQMDCNKYALMYTHDNGCARTGTEFTLKFISPAYGHSILFAYRIIITLYSIMLLYMYI